MEELMVMNNYDANYYRRVREGARRSAEVIVPLIVDWTRPQSVVDVGCGVGTWLSVFKDHGVADVWGIDGPHNSVEHLEITKERFFEHDLEEPFTLDRSFDLVVSLEVAEHLGEEAADIFIDTLVQLGPVILFSAAVPHQGGVHHVNEQWPKYWAERFASREYRAMDILRDRIWHNSEVEWWYAQNTILYAQKDFVGRGSLPAIQSTSTDAFPLSRVHPKNAGTVWEEWTLELFDDIKTCTSSDATIILADEARIATDATFDRTVLPFLENNGRYNGLPQDDFTAIQELNRLQGEGANYFAFAWPTFWWLEHYPGFYQHLHSRYSRTLRNERVIVFDLRSRA